MAKQLTSLRKKKLPKAPKMNSSTAVWQRYEKKKKEVLAHNKAVDTEKARRQRLKAAK